MLKAPIMKISDYCNVSNKYLLKDSITPNYNLSLCINVPMRYPLGFLLYMFCILVFITSNLLTNQDRPKVRVHNQDTKLEPMARSNQRLQNLQW